MARPRQLFLTVVIDDAWFRLHVLCPRCGALSLISDPSCHQNLRPSTTVAGKDICAFVSLVKSKHGRRAELWLAVQPAQATPRSSEIVVHFTKNPPLLQTAPIYEAVCISNPDGYADSGMTTQERSFGQA